MSPVRSTLLVSQVPLDVTGGGELFSIRSFEQLAKENPDSELWYAESMQCPTADHAQRMQHFFVRATLDEEKVIPQEKLPLRSLLNRLAGFDAVAVHQYLSAGTTIDFIGALAPDQQGILTSLGHEPFSPFFARVYEPAGNVHLMEISEYAAERARQRGHAATGVAAGIFERNIREPRRTDDRKPCKAVGLGRLLPHKGFEVSIAGLPESWELTIVGPPSGDSAYEAMLGELAEQSENVRVLGFLPQFERDRMLVEADALIASSTQTLYDGQYLEQAELFGLVLLEAVGAGTIPVASDLPSFREIMRTLGLDDFVYRERDAQHLNGRLSALQSMPAVQRERALTSAQEQLRQKYLWETYWQRIYSHLPAMPSRTRVRARLVA